jgi:hypothetical protein
LPAIVTAAAVATVTVTVVTAGMQTSGGASNMRIVYTSLWFTVIQAAVTVTAVQT